MHCFFLVFFSAECHLLQKDRILLVAHGLDTVSQVYLNDKLIGDTDNMFTRYQFDIKSLLQVTILNSFLLILHLIL